MTLSRLIRTGLATIVVLAGAPHLGGAQQCEHVSTQTTLASLSGKAIRSVSIVALPMRPLPGPVGAFTRMHVATRPSTVRRQLLFAAGDTVDTLRVSESLRRLRRLRYLGDVVLDGTQCAGRSGVDLTVSTRDEWSTKPNVQLSSGTSSVIGLTERNVLGTGREASLYLRADGSRLGVGAALQDPWLLGGRLAASLTTDSYQDGREWGAVVGTRPRDLLDPVRVQVAVRGLTRRPSDGVGDAFLRSSGRLLGTVRAHVSPDAVVAALAGVELDRTQLNAAADAIILGPGKVQRDFRGIDVGASRTALQYDTLTWMLPDQAIVDVPLALEGSAVVGVGQDGVTGRPATHLDLWAGQAWLPTHGSLLVADLWGSGYLGRGTLSAATLRASVVASRQAPRGTWTARLTGERLVRPDPDVRAFSSYDLTAPAISPDTRLADAAVALSLERTLHLARLNRSWSLDGVGFTAGSMRWETARAGAEQVDVGVVGFGIGLAPNKPGRGSARITVAYPAVGSPAVQRRPYLQLTLVPWFGQGRHRDGQWEER